MADLEKEWRLANAARHYKLYSDYAANLRLWLVAYGIGAPLLFVNSETLSNKLLLSPHAFIIVAIFLLGVMSQVIIALINKWSSWYLYAASTTTRFKHSLSYKAALWFSDRFWIDLSFDIITIILFSAATLWLMLLIQ